MKKLLSTLTISFILTACSGGGGSGGNGNTTAPQANNLQPPQVQQLPEQNLSNKSNNNNQASKAQGNNGDTATTPQKPKENNGNTEIEIPQNPSNPEDSKPTYTVEARNQNGATSINANEKTLTIYEISGNPDDENKFNKIEKTIELTEPTTKGGGYEFTLLGDDAYYGYFTELEGSNKELVTYVLGYDKALKSDSNTIATLKGATYYAKEGFMFTKNREPRVNTAEINIEIGQNNQVSGYVQNPQLTNRTNENGIDDGKLFNISGNLDNLTFAPTTASGLKEKGTSDPIFTNSAKDKQDAARISGFVTTSGDEWHGVFSAEKE